MIRKKNGTQKEITRIVKNLKKQNKKIVTFNGSFDILHAGHIKSFQEAKKLGDILIVLLNSDKSVRSYKGPNRPINSQEDRAQVLAALEYIDFITVFDELTPNEILAKIKPDIHCKGKEWGKNCIERAVVEKNGGRIHILKWQKGLSTSRLIEKFSEVYSKLSPKAVFLDRDGTININEPEYLYKKKDFKFVPNTIPALQKLSKIDYKIIILTNQSGISRGYFKEEDLKKLHHWMIQELKKKGIRIDRIYYCPHHAKNNCSCRKPRTGMVLRAVKDFGIALNKSWIIGDSERDIIMGRKTNLKTVKISKKMSKKLKLEAHYYVKNLSEAISIIQK